MHGARLPIGNCPSVLVSCFMRRSWQLTSTQMDQWIVPERVCAYVSYVGSVQRWMQSKTHVKRSDWVSSNCGRLDERIYFTLGVIGVTISLECGDVWIYNRSNVPIFVDSPTLAEHLDRVCKVLPGYCLKAFEIHR